MYTPATTLWSFLWHYTRDKHAYLVVILVVAVVWAVELSLSPYLLKQIVDIVVAHYQTTALLEVVWWPAVAYVSMSWIMNIAFRSYDYMGLRTLPHIKSDLSQDMFDYLQGHSYHYFQDHFPGSLTKQIWDMVQSAESIIVSIGSFFIPRVLALGVACFTLGTVITPVLGIGILVWALIFISVSAAGAKYAAKYAHTMADKGSIMSGGLSDALSNINSTKLFYQRDYESKRVGKSLDALIKADQDLLWCMLKTEIWQGLGVSLLIIGTLWVLLDGATKGQVSAGDFAMTLSLISWLTFVVWDFGTKLLELSRSVGIGRAALRFVLIPHAIKDVPHAKPLIVREGAISLRQVTYSYPKHPTPLFQDLNIEIHPGEKVGLVGYSGGGKSSLVRLILRLMDVQKGVIAIDGQDIAQVTEGSLRAAIGVIPQETELFHRTIMENIRFARPEASDAEVIEAAHKACCHAFIMELEHGYDSLVGERGVKLSGGQKQRIAIARAFLKNAPILLLDEATSALDSVTEQQIQSSIEAVMRGKTTLVIAHRLSTLQRMDRILFFNKGIIVEQGTLGALLNNKHGRFYQLWQMQSEAFSSQKIF